MKKNNMISNADLINIVTADINPNTDTRPPRQI